MVLRIVSTRFIVLTAAQVLPSFRPVRNLLNSCNICLNQSS
jgi:hypothetical protein